MKINEILTEAKSAHPQQAAKAIAMKKAGIKPKNESAELEQEFDLIESIINRLAQHNGVDAEVIWEDLETLTEDELYAFAVTSEPIMESQGMAEGSLNEFAIPGGGDGDSGRWYNDDELADIIGDDWFEDFDVSNDGFNIDAYGEKAKKNLVGYANTWFDDKGYNVNVMGVEHNDVDHDLQWYIVGSFHNPRFANEGVAEGQADQVKKIVKKNGKPVGEIGTDPEASPGNGNWYVKHYASGYDVVGFDNAEEALAELKHCMKQGVAEAKADSTGTWVVYNGSKVTKFKTREGAKAYAEKNGGTVASSEYYHDKIQKQDVAEDWQKANKRDKTDGMSQKAVNAYRRENPGSKLKTAVTTKPGKLKKGGKASKRRKSYCSRSRGQMKMHSISCAKTPDKAICKARRRWNC
jgi:hypothetical protein